MCIWSKFNKWHALFFLSSQYCHMHGMHLICFFRRLCKANFALVLNCCKSNKIFRDQCSIFNHNFLLYSGFFFFSHAERIPCLMMHAYKRSIPFMWTYSRKKVFNIFNFANMFLSHEVKILLLDNTIYHFSSTRIIWNEKYNPLQLKMKISIGLNLSFELLLL